VRRRSETGEGGGCTRRILAWEPVILLGIRYGDRKAAAALSLLSDQGESKVT
jgi:hypothetical protein